MQLIQAYWGEEEVREIFMYSINIMMYYISVDGAIHSAAGWSLRDECEELNGCKPGHTKLTTGHRLPAKCNQHQRSHIVYKLLLSQKDHTFYILYFMNIL